MFVNVCSFLCVRSCVFVLVCSFLCVRSCVFVLVCSFLCVRSCVFVLVCSFLCVRWCVFVGVCSLVCVFVGVCVRWCVCSLVCVFVGVCVRWCVCSLVCVFVGVCVRWCVCSLVCVFVGVCSLVCVRWCVFVGVCSLVCVCWWCVLSPWTSLHQTFPALLAPGSSTSQDVQRGHMCCVGEKTKARNVGSQPDRAHFFRGPLPPGPPSPRQAMPSKIVELSDTTWAACPATGKSTVCTQVMLGRHTTYASMAQSIVSLSKRERVQRCMQCVEHCVVDERPQIPQRLHSRDRVLLATARGSCTTHPWCRVVPPRALHRSPHLLAGELNVWPIQSNEQIPHAPALECSDLICH